MALVRIEIHAGKPAEYRKALVDGIHRALVQALGVPAGEVLQRVYELDAGHFVTPPGSSSEVTLIEVTLFRGYSVEAKQHLFRCVAANLGADPGIAADDVRVVLHDPPLQNWGIRGEDLSERASTLETQSPPP